MSFIVRNLSVTEVIVDDLGITLAALSDFNLIDSQANDVASSTDLLAGISAGNLVILDPLDGVTPLSLSVSLAVVSSHNDPHYGIRGGTLDQLDDVDLTGATNLSVIQLVGGVYVPVTPAALIGGSVELTDLADVTDATPHTIDTFYTFKGDGTDLVVVDAASDPLYVELIEDIVGGLVIDGNDSTVVYDDGAGTLKIDINDSFLRNDGDTLDSGTLIIAPGAAISVSAGGSLTITDVPVNQNDAVNKAYVDTIASGLDPKESVRVATIADLGATYSAVGGGGASGGLISAPTTVDGIVLTGGDRILVKNQTIVNENGIYTVISAGVWSRAEDQDGSPTNEVSGGNFTLVEGGTTHGTSGWVLQGDGNLTLNTDPLVWVQFSDTGDFQGGLGISRAGLTFDLDLNDLTPATATATDFISFHDTDGIAGASGSITRKTSVADFITDLGLLVDGTITASDGVLITAGGDIQLDITNVPAATITGAAEFIFDAGTTGTHNKVTATDILSNLDIVHSVGANGIVVQTTTGAFSSVSVVVDGVGALEGLSVIDGDGVAGNPTIGLDIDGTTAATEELDATDTMVVYNTSGSANQKITGQEVADGVSTILGLTNMTITTINGQPVLTIVDSTRTDKVLSVETSVVTWSDNKLGNNDWVSVGNATDAKSGFVIPMDATIVHISAHTSDDNGITKDIVLYIDAVDSGVIGTFSGVGGENAFNSTTVNIDVNQNQNIRLRGGPTNGFVEDIIISIWLKWRG